MKKAEFSKSLLKKLGNKTWEEVDTLPIKDRLQLLTEINGFFARWGI